jgi:acyl carrier protein
MKLLTADVEKIRATITDYLSNKFAVNLGDSINDQTDLFQEGLIDSFGFVELVSFLEKTFEIRFEDRELTFDSLNTVSNIVSSVEKKKALQ